MKKKKKEHVSGQVGIRLLRGGVRPLEGSVRTPTQQEIQQTNKVRELKYLN